MFAKVAYITLCTLALSSFCISCTEGYDEDPEFSPGVSNTQLLSPPSDSIKCHCRQQEKKSRYRGL